MAELPRHRFCVLYGAPGTGKTTLVERLLHHNSAPDCPFYFAVLPEPTSDPEIAGMIKQTYEEAGAPANNKIAVRTQEAIIDAREKMYRKFFSEELPSIKATAWASHKYVVVVSDGHFLTDLIIYVASKFMNGQIEKHDMEMLGTRVQEIVNGEEGFMPDLFFQLVIQPDVNGEKHWARIKNRGSSVESGVPADAFLMMAKCSMLAPNYLTGLALHIIANTHEISIDEIDGAFLHTITQEFCEIHDSTVECAVCV